MDVGRTQWQRSESLEQHFLSMTRPHHTKKFLTTTCYVHVVLSTSSLRLLEHVQSSTSSFTPMKNLTTLLSRPISFYFAPTTSYKFLLRPSIFQGRSKNVNQCEGCIMRAAQRRLDKTHCSLPYRLARFFY